jgi:Transposase DDE domain
MRAYVCGPCQQSPGQPHMGTAVLLAKTFPASWDAFSDVDAFVDAVLTELESMAAEGARPTRPGPKPALAGAALRKAVMAIWCACFCGMQWRAIGQLCDIPFATLYTLFARWTRLGLWGRLLNRLILAWRRACGDTPEPSAVIIDSRSCPSAPSCFGRGFDGGKKIKGIKIHLAVDKYGFPLAIHVSPANRHDSKGIVPVLHQLAGRGFQGTALGDLSYRGQRLSKAGEALGITVEPSAGGHGGTFIPDGIRWVVERSFAWLARYRRLNSIFERTQEHLVAFIEIAFVSILSRRLKRLVIEEV